MIDNTASLEVLLKNLPNKPGCYLMQDETGKVIYIGAASNLKKRISSYFRRDISDPKTKQLVQKIKFFDYEIHGSEEAAFLRERDLIRIYSPKFNLDWKDDKQYPMIRITVPSDKERFSRLFIVRDITISDDWYFGRKTDVKALRESIQQIRKTFPTANKTYCFRTKKVCLDYSINRCSGPCVGKISLKAYQQVVDQLILFLQGKRKDLVDNLFFKMNEASNNLNFELAAKIRDRIIQIERTIDTQKGVIQPRDEDIIVLIQESNYYMLCVFWIKDNKIFNTETRFLGNLEVLSDSEIIKSFIHNYYLNAEFIPNTIIISNSLLQETEILELWLSKKQGKTIQITIQHDINEDSRIKIEINRFQLMLGEKIRSENRRKQLFNEALLQLKEYLSLPSIPARIETFDISNIQGKFSVGSMVVFENGEPIKSQYRRFKIKSVDSIPNDVAMLTEIIDRRLKESDPNFATSLPDLIVLDGGKPQVNSINDLLKKMNKDFTVIGLAKKEENVYLPESKNPVPIPKNSPALRLLQQTRDEAHRFAISFHKKRRIKQIDSKLDQIPGVGIKRRNALLKFFGDIEGIQGATVDDLCRVQGINRALAERIFLFFKNNNKNNDFSFDR